MSGEWGLNDIRAKVAALESAPPGGSAWGSITGTLSAQTDLQTALNGKAAVAHTHAIADVTGLQAALDSKQAAGSYQPLSTVLTNTTAAFTTAQETKLAGIATGATANSSDAFLLSRANHTGTQAIATVTGLQTALDGKEAVGVAAAAVSAHAAAGDPHPQYQTQTEGDARYLQLTDRGATNGVAPLVAGLVPLANLPSLGGGSDPWTYAKLDTDFTTTSATAVNITGLAFTPILSTSYEFEAVLLLRTATATVGPRPGLAWATGLTDGVADIEMPTSGTASVRVFGNINAALLAAVGGLPNTTQSYPSRIRGTAIAGLTPSGTIRLQLASETAGTTVTAKAGSWLRYRAI